MSVNCEIYASTTLSPPFSVIKSMLAASPLPVDFNDGPFAASLLRNAAWDYSSFDVIADDTLRVKVGFWGFQWVWFPGAADRVVGRAGRPDVCWCTDC